MTALRRHELLDKYIWTPNGAKVPNRNSVYWLARSKNAKQLKAEMAELYGACVDFSRAIDG